MATGYLYCISNKTIPDILRIGVSDSPNDYVKRLNNAKIKYPTPFVLEFVKKVKNPIQKMYALYALLDNFTIHIHPDKDVFKLEVREAKMFFDLIEKDTSIIHYKKCIVIIIVILMSCVFWYYFKLTNE